MTGTVQAELLHTRATLDSAKEKAAAAVNRLLPVGTIIEFNKGRARIRARVIYRANVWTDPTTLTVENISTGGRHRVDASWSRAELAVIQ